MTAPKPSSARRRRNATHGSTLYVVEPGDINVPPLPSRRIWQQETVERWEGLFSSPMAPEFLSADLYNLYDLAELWDDYLLAEDADNRIKLSKEIRIKGQAFGLTPMDRRKLSWEIEKGEQAELQTRARRNRLAEVTEPAEDTYSSFS